MIPSIDGFRRLNEEGRAALEGMLRRQPNDRQLNAGLREYRKIFGILDALTPEEVVAPLESIDAGRLKRIAGGAGVRDQDVIQFLFGYRDYCEQILRADWRQRRGSA